MSRVILLKRINGDEETFPMSIVRLEKEDGGYRIKDIFPFENEIERVEYVDIKLVLEEIQNELWEIC